MMMVATVSPAPHEPTPHHHHTPLLPSDFHNAHPKPKPKKLIPSPAAPKRSHSADRSRRPTPTSTRRLSVSFQEESFSLPISKPPPSSPPRRITPDRRRPTPPRSSPAAPSDPQPRLWPARARFPNPPLSRSLDCTAESAVVPQSALLALRHSVVGAPAHNRRSSLVDGQLSLASNSNAGADGGSCCAAASDADSLSSGSNSGMMHELTGTARVRGMPRGGVVPAKFLQEAATRTHRSREPPGGSLLLTTGSRTASTAPKPVPSKKALSGGNLGLSPRAVPSSKAAAAAALPLRGGAMRSLSPGKMVVSSPFSPSRGTPSPSRMQSSGATSAGNQPTIAPSIINFAADVRRRKMGENKIEDAHVLRILYNRYLQWRFVNARTDACVAVQRLISERNLFNAWVTTCKLRDSVAVGRIRVQLLRQNLKLNSILCGQMSYLEECALLDRDHASSLAGAVEALRASTLVLPVTNGAKADIQEVKDAVGSAVDVMQALGSSTRSLSSRVEGLNFLVADCASLTLQEQALLTECKDLLSTIAAMQAEECSLKTHLLQGAW